MAYPALKVIRPVMRLSSRITPRLAGRLAFRLFCTPFGHAPVDPRKPMIRQAKALFAGAKARTVPFCRGHVRSYTFEPAAPAMGSVLLLHGWTGQALFMAGFVQPLLAAGFRVVAMDLPAHGGSSGSVLNIPLAVEAVSAVVRDHLPLAGIVCHSFGGAVAMAAIAGGVEGFPAIPCDRLVTIAAPDSMKRYGDAFSAAVGLNRQAHHAFEARVLEVAGRPMESFAGRVFLAMTQVPALVIHAPDDREIPFADAEALADASPRARLLAMPGLGHRRILLDARVHEAAAGFITAGGRRA